MKKRLISAVLSTVMVFSLAGCGGKEISQKADINTSSAGGTEAVTTTTAETQTLLPITLEQDDQEQSAPDISSAAENTEPSDITPLMWELTADDGVTLTMVGAMHALKDDCYPLPKVITDAYDKAELLVCECDTSTVTQNFALQIEQLKNMYYDAGDSIEDHIGKEMFDKLVAFGKEFGVDMTIYSSCKPWIWSSMLEMMLINELGLKNDLGLDIFLTNKAHEDGKEIAELESAEFQTRLIMDLSDDIEKMLLSNYADSDKESMLEELISNYEAWKQGDEDFFIRNAYADKMAEAAKAEGKEFSEEYLKTFEAYNKEMTFDRNLNMKDKVIEILKSGKKNIFLTVGTAHFIGEKGLIALLEAEGYKIKKIMPAEAEPAESEAESSESDESTEDAA